MPKHIFTVDADVAASLATQGFEAGQVFKFNDGLPTMDDGIAFFVSQLEQLEAKIYEAKYANITFMEDVEFAEGIPETADTWSYISYDAVTAGKFIGANAEDVPNVALNAKKSIVEIGHAGNKFGYSLDELRKSQALRIPLDSTMAKMALRGALEHQQRVAYTGDTSRGMGGLFTGANVPVISSSVTRSTATGAELVADMDAILRKVWTDSKNIHVPNTLLLPSSHWALIQSKRMDSGTDTTVLEYFLKNNLYTGMTGQALTVKPRLQLKGAAVGGVNDRAMAYEKNPENLAMARPLMFRPLAPQIRSYNIDIFNEYKMSGVEFRFPMSATYQDYADTLA